MKCHPRLPAMMEYSAAVLCLILGAAADAEAYLDPGTGSVVLQVLAAGVFGLLFLLKSYWRKLLALVGHRGPAALHDRGSPGTRER